MISMQIDVHLRLYWHDERTKVGEIVRNEIVIFVIFVVEKGWWEIEVHVL